MVRLAIPLSRLGNGVRLLSIAGVPIRVSLWLLPVTVVSVALGQAEALACILLAVAAHELGHALCARMLGLTAGEIGLCILGGIFRLSAGIRYAGWRETVVALAGPATSMFLAMATQLAALEWQLPQPLLRCQPVHLTLAVFNLLPALPMDGGRALRGMLCAPLGNARATRVCVWLTRGIALASFAWTAHGLAHGRLTLAPPVIGAFLFASSFREGRSAAGTWGALLEKRNIIRRGNVLPVRTVAVYQNVRLGDALKGLSRAHANRVLVVDASLRTLADLDETQLSHLAARHGLDAPIDVELK